MMFWRENIWSKLSRTYNVGAVTPFPLENPGVLVIRQDLCPRHGVILLQRGGKLSEGSTEIKLLLKLTIISPG